MLELKQEWDADASLTLDEPASQTDRDDHLLCGNLLRSSETVSGKPGSQRQVRSSQLGGESKLTVAPLEPERKGHLFTR
jgi:hypothetical protein